MDAYLGRQPKGYDQLVLFSEQAQREFNFLYGGVELVINDAPLLLNVYYTLLNGCDYWKHAEKIAIQHHQDFPSMDIFIHRGGRKFNPKGRFQTEEQARELDDRIVDYIDDVINNKCHFGSPLFTVPNTEAVVPFVMGMLTGKETTP